MNILVISQFYYPESFSITPLCEGLVKAGHTVSVVTSQPQYGFQHPKLVRRPTDEILAGVNVHRLDVVPRKKGVLSILHNYFSFYTLSKRYVQKLPPTFDVVFSMSFSPLMSVSAGIVYAKKHRIKHLLYAVDLWPEAAITSGYLKRNSMLEQWVRSQSKKIYQSVDFLLVGSPGHVDYFKRVHHLQPDSMAILIQPTLHEREKKVLHKHEKHHWVYAGNLGRLQPLESMMTSLTLPSMQKIELSILGIGSEKSRLEKTINRLGLQHRVHCLGSLTSEQSQPYMEKATVFVIALKADGFIGATIPSKAVHYLSYGKPIMGLLGKEGQSWLDQIQGPGWIVTEEKDYPLAMLHALSMDEREYQTTCLNIQKYYQTHLSLSNTVKQLEHYLIRLSKSSN